jgi:two-component system nitrogen regulation sensor histidine kinase NtrY
MKSPRRFERKILLAIVSVGFVAVVGGVGFAGVAVQEAYRVGVNREVGEQLEHGLDATRRYFVEYREHVTAVAEHLADHHDLRRAIEARDAAAAEGVVNAFLIAEPSLVFVRLDVGDFHVDRGAEPSEGMIERDVPLAPAGSLHAVFREPLISMAEYERSGQLVDLYGRFEQNTRVVSAAYVKIYLACLSLVVLAAVAVAIVASRRVTRRIALVAAAAKRVGRGDFSVALPVDSSDEIADLTRAFNEMVRDIKRSRERIDYLQRIGAWQDFARRLAHEIKNPLTPIQLAVQEMHRRYDGDDEKYRRTLSDAKGIVEEEVATLRRLVSEFSSFAKLPEAHLEPADLSEFAVDAAKSFELAGVLSEDVRLRLVVGETKLPVEIDAMMLKRCVDNLVRNGAQAIRAHKGSGEVVLEAHQEEEFAVLTVRDDGPGVAEADRERVFEPYFTTKSDGTGLGLAIVKKIVLEHAGDISCDAASGGGAMFRIRLPLRTETP